MLSGIFSVAIVKGLVTYCCVFVFQMAQRAIEDDPDKSKHRTPSGGSNGSMSASENEEGTTNEDANPELVENSNTADGNPLAPEDPINEDILLQETDGDAETPPLGEVEASRLLEITGVTSEDTALTMDAVATLNSINPAVENVSVPPAPIAEQQPKQPQFDDVSDMELDAEVKNTKFPTNEGEGPDDTSEGAELKEGDEGYELQAKAKKKLHKKEKQEKKERVLAEQKEAAEKKREAEKKELAEAKAKQNRESSDDGEGIESDEGTRRRSRSRKRKNRLAANFTAGEKSPHGSKSPKKHKDKKDKKRDKDTDEEQPERPRSDSSKSRERKSKKKDKKNKAEPMDTTVASDSAAPSDSAPRKSKSDEKSWADRMENVPIPPTGGSDADAGAKSEVEGPRRVKRRRQRVEIPVLNWTRMICSSLDFDKNGKCLQRAPRPGKLFEREWCCAAPDVERNVNGQLMYCADKASAKDLPRDFYLKRDYGGHKLRCFNRTKFEEKSIVKFKTVRPLIPDPNDEDDVAWAAYESETEEDLCVISRDGSEQRFPNGDTYMKTYWDLYETLVSCVCWDTDETIPYKDRWELAHPESMSRVQWAIDTFIPGQRCPFQYCRMEEMHFYIGIRSYATKERFVRHVTELHCPAIKAYRCPSPSGVCKVNTNRRCELARHLAKAGQDDELKKPLFSNSHRTSQKHVKPEAYSKRHSWKYEKALLRASQVEGVITKNGDFVIMSVLPRDLHALWWKQCPRSGWPTPPPEFSARDRSSEPLVKRTKASAAISSAPSTSKNTAASTSVKPKFQFVDPADAPTKKWADPPKKAVKANVTVDEAAPAADVTPTEKKKDKAPSTVSKDAATTKVDPVASKVPTPVSDVTVKLGEASAKLKTDLHARVLDMRQGAYKEVKERFKLLEDFTVERIDEIGVDMAAVLSEGAANEQKVLEFQRQNEELQLDVMHQRAMVRERDDLIDQLKRQLMKAKMILAQSGDPRANDLTLVSLQGVTAPSSMRPPPGLPSVPTTSVTTSEAPTNEQNLSTEPAQQPTEQTAMEKALALMQGAAAGEKLMFVNKFFDALKPSGS